jgi:polyphosphate kinase
VRPEVEGVSDRILVRSIVGRFLEHSRVFWFGNAGQPRVYIGSADLMERNLDRRVEVLCPIHDRRHAEYLRTVVLDTYRSDSRNAWRLAADGSYTRVTGAAEEGPIDAQQVLLEGHARGHAARIDPVDWDIDDW